MSRRSLTIKEETGDIRRVTDMVIEFGDRFAIFCGVDDQIVESWRWAPPAGFPA
jgi:dihydrodipicolinate synthase/N-acetylneuraminate lyase